MPVARSSANQRTSQARPPSSKPLLPSFEALKKGLWSSSRACPLDHHSSSFRHQPLSAHSRWSARSHQTITQHVSVLFCALTLHGYSRLTTSSSSIIFAFRPIIASVNDDVLSLIFEAVLLPTDHLKYAIDELRTGVYNRYYMQHIALVSKKWNVSLAIHHPYSIARC